MVRTALKCTAAEMESDVVSARVCESSSSVKAGWLKKGS